MKENLFSSTAWLRRDSNRGYGALPIPQPRDSEISNLLETWMALEEPARIEAALHVLDEQRPTLLAYSERMASLAVRECNQDLIVLGLLALGIDGLRDDWRDNVLIISLHFDAAQRIGAAPDAIFEKAAQLLPEKSASALRSFLRRSNGDKAINAMGYLAGNDDDGFRYLRTW